MNRKTTKKVDESTLTTLCAVCRGAFLDAKGVHLRRADPRQLVKDVCTYCQTRYGFDYYADMEPHIGSEQGGKRPVVVLQNNIGNRHSPTLIVATVTTRTEKKKKQPTHVLVDSNPAFEEPSMILWSRSSRSINPASNALWAMPARLKCSALIWLCWSVWL